MGLSSRAPTAIPLKALGKMAVEIESYGPPGPLTAAMAMKQRIMLAKNYNMIQLKIAPLNAERFRGNRSAVASH